MFGCVGGYGKVCVCIFGVVCIIGVKYCVCIDMIVFDFGYFVDDIQCCGGVQCYFKDWQVIGNQCGGQFFGLGGVVDDQNWDYWGKCVQGVVVLGLDFGCYGVFFGNGLGVSCVFCVGCVRLVVLVIIQLL